MIIRKDRLSADPDTKGRAARFGAFESLRVSDAGGLTQYGAYIETLQPGSRSSERHWHEQEDEFLYVLSGEATVVEDDGAHLLYYGDAACWPAGAANAHQVVNRSAAPCTYLIFGTRVTHDICHYPDVGRTLYTEGDAWRIESADGSIVKSGTISK